MSDPTQQDIGALKKGVDNLEKQFDAMQKDIREMRDLMQNVKGGWKMLLMLGTISAALGAAVTKFISYLPVLK